MIGLHSGRHLQKTVTKIEAKPIAQINKTMYFQCCLSLIYRKYTWSYNFCFQIIVINMVVFQSTKPQEIYLYPVYMTEKEKNFTH